MSSAAIRLIDPRGHRFGAGVSVILLLLGFVAGVPALVPFVAAALGASALLGTRYSLLGRPWAPLRRLLRIAPPRELESELPPRFAQALGTAGLALATVLLASGLAPLGWLVVAAVAGLQTLLAATGYCLGCRLFFLRWWVPSLFRRLVGGDPGLTLASSRVRIEKA